MKKIIPGIQLGDKRKTFTSDVETQKLYHSVKWRKMREQVLMADPMCRKCAEYGRYGMATVVDHIVPVTRGGDFYDFDNLQPLCAYCHNAKSARERWSK